MNEQKVAYSSWRMDDSVGTPVYGVRYNIPGEEHILCIGMYKWQADWLVARLNESGEYPEVVRGRSHE